MHRIKKHFTRNLKLRYLTMLAFRRAVYMVSSSDLRASNSSIFFHFFFKESSASFLSEHNLFKRCTSAISVFKLDLSPAASRSFAQTSNCTPNFIFLKKECKQAQTKLLQKLFLHPRTSFHLLYKRKQNVQHL